ncbi:flagellar export protein FliJ [Undibacterium sp.]|jgi:flagellar export protein FliJ|uniref:flagellar export protein FliJ n=1 Tax=Undibacterium sp. TaxID=1914977 RepID=UPI002B7EB104|nr:flagellar export protein FliJ [Undibacterium sp.]HTD04167.1 flagellar export protein FliJ [Undibacterium sp.]
MTKQSTINSLSTLVSLRSKDVDRLQADLSGKTRVRDRYHANLERLAGLCADSGASGALPMALSLNCANYKQVVLQMADSHRNDLSLHEADMAVTQQALGQAWRKREVLGQVLEQKQSSLANERHRNERKQQDELGAQAWYRGKQG